MHIQTHILSGWCMGNLLPLSPRERLCCMIVSAIPDIDSLSRLGGQECYWNWHHTLGHNLPLGILASALLATFSRRKFLPFLTCLALFHLHLAMDYYGSGPGWHIHYLWPLQHIWKGAQSIWLNKNAWEFYSWQNITTAFVLIAWTILIAIRARRTPLECIMPQLDQKIVRFLRRERVVVSLTAFPDTRPAPSVSAE